MKKKLTTLDEIIESEYGKIGELERDEFEARFEAFRLGIMLHELRKEQGLTQKDVAEKCNTSASYISRIENDASDIRLSTLIRIIKQGLNGNIEFNIKLT
ncbi:MAG: helix-turn-helix domain-containing protein [Oscillospiraceae bacterium]|jgi:DNA-binding XRE family transcriptional regulator|nr:helix-turn-helix domain-containing protein [Oscillospiraceae bacterium]